MSKPLRHFIDKIKPAFDEGGRFAALQSTFEAFETFAYTPNTVTKHGSHIRDAIDMKRAMIIVVIALIPALLFGMWNIGYQHYTAYVLPVDTGTTDFFWQCFGFGLLRMLPMIAVSYIVGLTIEFAFAQIRHHEVNEGYLVTGLLIPMIMPPTVPLWQLALAVAFAVVVGKEVFGGTGMNFMNPALLARAFLFFAYPSHMSGDKVWTAAKAWGTDAVTGATPLAELKANAVNIQSMQYSLGDLFWGIMPGSCCETSTAAILVGAILLLVTGIASWRIMAGVVLGGGAIALLFNLIGLNSYMQVPFYYHYLLGGFMFGAVFMATDPVTAPQTNPGRWIYALLTGALAILLRVVNPAYPEGMMLSILLMNCFAPLIDHCVIAVNIKKRSRRATNKQ
ncbi:MAG: NADH:ubiquinone reductase (Na(+)-transporting) subunit B [Bacteroidales bacterium]|nr:NADH:ubiquinone reductase (Na(+)-transporting) subunit B [Bacteroidales bacterium]